jgi:hypothetical protein
MHGNVSTNASQISLNRSTEAHNSERTVIAWHSKQKIIRPVLIDVDRMPSPFKTLLSPGQKTMSEFVVPARKRRIDDNDSDDDKPLVPSAATTPGNPVLIYDTDDNFAVILRSGQPPAPAAATVAASAAAPQVTLKPRRSRHQRVKHQSQQTVSIETLN